MPPVSAFSSHFVPWWKFNYSRGARWLRGRRVTPVVHPLWSNVLHQKTTTRRRSGFRVLLRLRERYECRVRQLGLHFYEHWDVLRWIQWFTRAALRGWRSLEGRRGEARGLRRVQAAGGRASTRHWPTLHRSRDELKAARPRQPASTYVNK